MPAEGQWQRVERCVQLSLLGLNAGLALMIVSNLFPGGVLQLWDVLQQGCWHARGPEFLSERIMRIIEWCMAGPVFYYSRIVTWVAKDCMLPLRRDYYDAANQLWKTELHQEIANYFERIPQHHLVNLIIASGCPTEVARLLEEMLLAFQERDSLGIIQGLFPSDLFSNFYLSDVDAYCEIQGIRVPLRVEVGRQARRADHLVETWRDGSIPGAGAGASCPAIYRRNRGGEKMVRAEGLEPSRAFAQRIFVPSTAFAAPPFALASTSAGLRSGLSLHRAQDLLSGVRCCPSSLYTFPAGMFRPGLARDCHVKGFPEFGQFCIAGFPASTQVLPQVPFA